MRVRMADLNQWLTYTILLCCCATLCRSVTITRLVVPRAVLANTSSVVMDCVYTVPQDQRRGLVVKWYVDGVHLVYQWIPPQQPQALGLLSGRVDTSHRAAAQAWARHRAIRITELEPILSGDYSCTVSTYEDEDTRTAPLLVWVPSSGVHVQYWRPSEHLVNITCIARDIAPKPSFTLYTLFPDRTRSNVQVRGRMETSKGGGLWDVGVWGLIVWVDTPQDTVVGCIVTVPDSNYKETQEKIYNPDLPIITTTTTTTTTTTPRPWHSSNISNNVPATTASLFDFSSLFGPASQATRRRASLYLKCLAVFLLGFYHWRRGHL